MKSRTIQILVVVLIGSLAKAFNLPQRRPSSAEELARVVLLTRSLEARPLGNEASKSRKWLREWMNKTAEIRVPLCPSLSRTKESKSKHDEELSFQIRASMAAFMIERLDQAENPEARLTAGIEGLVRAYGAILQRDPGLHSEFFDLLSRKQKSNQIQQTIREVMARCSDVPLSDKTPPSYHTPDTVYALIEVGRPPDIKYNPYPEYSRDARLNQTRGKVVLQVVLASTGKVTDVKVIEGLPNGLTENAVATAKRIQFDPAVTNGHPVSTLVRIAYSFDIF